MYPGHWLARIEEGKQLNLASFGFVKKRHQANGAFV
jgi:hypothetical protein